MQTYCLDFASVLCASKKQSKKYTLVGQSPALLDTATHHIHSHSPDHIVCISVALWQTKGYFSCNLGLLTSL